MLQRYGEASDRVEPKRAPSAKGGDEGVETRTLQTEASSEREGADHDALRTASTVTRTFR